LNLSSRYYLLFSTFIFSLLYITPVISQEKKPGFISRYINKIIKDTTDISKPQFLFYPVLSYAKETSLEFGLSTLYLYYVNRDTTNRLSQISGYTFYTLENQYGIVIDHSNYTDKQKWAALGKIRLQYFPLKYFGIGMGTGSEELAKVDANLLMVKEQFLRQVKKDLFVGLKADFQKLGSVEFISHGTAPLDLPLGSEGSTNFGLGAGIIFDNRYNPMNARKGVYSEISFLRYDDAWGSDYSFSSVVLDNRFYFPINKRDVLATQVYAQFSAGEIPFNMLSLMGGESLMRGYYQGRYRDKNQVAGQFEYRFLPLPFGFTNRIGMTAFGATGSVFNEFDKFSFDNFVFAGGGGLRYLLFPRKDIWGRVDLAFTKEGSGVYIGMGQAF
jgi:hypothetical protein